MRSGCASSTATLEALLVDPRDLPTADRMRRARDIYAAFVQFQCAARRKMPLQRR